jgi:hypothetical protein
MMQLLAAGWHFKSEAQCARIAAEVGPSRIQIIHGTKDNLVAFSHGQELAEAMGGEESGIKIRWVEGQGHVIPIEMRKEFHEWVEEIVAKTEAMDSSEKSGKENGANGHSHSTRSNGRVGNGTANGLLANGHT